MRWVAGGGRSPLETQADFISEPGLRQSECMAFKVVRKNKTKTTQSVIMIYFNALLKMQKCHD